MSLFKKIIHSFLQKPEPHVPLATRLRDRKIVAWKKGKVFDGEGNEICELANDVYIYHVFGAQDVVHMMGKPVSIGDPIPKEALPMLDPDEARRQGWHQK